ncbi:hypothetical protein SBOR_1502 [Sclerotinia borealis F-4128]|uniref:Uncharacterized protein n=1 Tax=Sclerotinia borealis (strain F-4128) TaxID=1432307 RepID=W9CPY4_SCLBF|nr:hypothetical protein SBOR_1502 [Sclerotinia borealis F-4128]
MASIDLGPLAMSQTKDDLVKHLNIGAETYTLMAKETDKVYRWLISKKGHLKKNCKGKPPYDWSDIVERSKDEAMKLIAQGGTDETVYYWNLARPTPDCPNWIARWFLYHKFRYRDGRNRNLKADNRDTVTFHSAAPPPQHHHHSHRHSHHTYYTHHRTVHEVEDHHSYSSYYPGASMNTDPLHSSIGTSQALNQDLELPSNYRQEKAREPNSSTSEYGTYSSSQTYAPYTSSYAVYTSSVARDNGQVKPYDPVRDL